MQIRDAAAVISTILLLACTGWRQGSEQDAVEAINRLQKEVDETIVRGDTEHYLTLLADDAVLMPPNAPVVVGKDAIRKWSQEMSKLFRIDRYAQIDDEVVVNGNWAFRRATYNWSLTSLASGKSLRDSGKFIIIYRRQPDGSWRVARDIWNSDTQAP